MEVFLLGFPNTQATTVYDQMVDGKQSMDTKKKLKVDLTPFTRCLMKHTDR